MTQSDRLWWREARGNGRLWFVFREGILRHGTRPAFYAAVLTLLGGAGLFDLIIASVVVAAIIGTFVGLALWRQFERIWSCDRTQEPRGLNQ